MLITAAEFKRNPHWRPSAQSWSLFDYLPMQRPQNMMIKLSQTVLLFFNKIAYWLREGSRMKW
jgi:hypothetical protein